MYFKKRYILLEINFCVDLKIIKKNSSLPNTPSTSLYFKVAAPVRVCKRAVYFNTRQTSWLARVPDHRVYDATGSQYQILRNNRSIFSKSASPARLVFGDNFSVKKS